MLLYNYISYTHQSSQFLHIIVIHGTHLVIILTIHILGCTYTLLLLLLSTSFFDVDILWYIHIVLLLYTSLPIWPHWQLLPYSCHHNWDVQKQTGVWIWDGNIFPMARAILGHKYQLNQEVKDHVGVPSVDSCIWHYTLRRSHAPK